MSVATRTGHTFSHYQVDDLLGSGGMGEVYSGVDLRLGRRVALKFLRPFADAALRTALKDEARAAARLDHPNICTIYEVDETPDGDVFFVMPHYDGETLDRILARGALDPPRAVSIALQTARGLAAAHDELIVHRDIAPGNVMIVRGDTVKILDFGVMQVMGDAHTLSLLQTAGTPAYMSPEQLRGEAVDQRTDIWSLGAVLYEMIAGVAPFRADTLAALVTRVLYGEPEPLSQFRPGASAPLEPIVVRALSKDRRARYERIEEMIHDLVHVQNALDHGALAPPRASRARSSLAVLPFADMSKEKDQEYLCDGIAEEIVRALSRVPDLHVASRTSSFQFRHRAADVRDIGAQLRVETVLEGSVRRVDNRVRISAQLVNVADGYRLWCERYDREMKDIFSVEEDIAGQIARALQVTFESAGSRAASRADAEAYELFLQGRQFIRQHRRKAFEVALQTFARAIDLQPDDARAYAGIAECHAFLRLYFGSGEEAVRAADEASARSLVLAPELSDAHAARGFALFLRNDFARAEEHLRRAIELDPHLYEPHYIYARLCFSMGRIAEAAERYRHACEIVPEAFDSWYLLGMCYRRLQDAVRARNADFECIEAVKKRVREHPDDTRAWTMGAAVLAEMGEPERAATWIDRALAVDADEPIIEYNAACVYTKLGRFDDALRCLTVAQRHGGLLREWARNDPDLDPLRDDPRFGATFSEGDDAQRTQTTARDAPAPSPVRTTA